MTGTGHYTTVTSYDLTVGVIVDMDEAIYLTSPTDSPFLTGVGSDGLSVLSSKPTNERKVEWMTDSILTPRTTLHAAMVTASTTVTLQTGDAARFIAGDLVLVDDETMLVVSTAPDELTVTRSTLYTSSVTTHASGATLIGVGTMLAEGSKPGDSRVTDRAPFYNVTQIFGPEQITLSGTEQVVAKYGVPNELNHQLFRNTIELTIRREQAILYGRRIEDTTALRRSMAGIYRSITSNVDSTSTQLTVTSIQTILQSSYDAGGQPDRLAANPKALSDLNSIGDVNRVRQDFADGRRGRVPTMEIWTEFGPLSVVRNRWLRTGTASTDAILFRRDQCVRRPLRPFQLERLAKVGDLDSMQMLCEESLEVKGQEHMAKFTALTY